MGFSNKFSIESYWLINKEAIFGPIPGAPGILSDESPAKACTSITLSGKTPNFSKTVSFVTSFFLLGLLLRRYLLITALSLYLKK